MRYRQSCTPHLVGAQGVATFERVPLDEKTINESRLQELIFEHPSLLPVDEIEPEFAPLFPLGREVRTDAGPVDVLYLSPKGYITLVETKLWRNPEARRQVVAQIIDYASAMSKWNYEHLREAVKRAGGEGEDPLVRAVQDEEGFEGETRFFETVSQSLKLGRFLLLIVGDGIEDGVEQLAEILSRSPQLRFALALVELALFRTSKDSDSLFIQPRLLARTREIVRAVIEVRAPSRVEDVVVGVPPAESAPAHGPRPDLTMSAFMEELARTTGLDIADQFRAFLNDAEKIGIEAELGYASVSLDWHEPNTGRRFSFGSVNRKGGRVDFKYVDHHYFRAGLESRIGLDYVSAVAALVPGAVVRDQPKRDRQWRRVFVGNREVTLADLLPSRVGWLKVLESAINETEQASDAKATA